MNDWTHGYVDVEYVHDFHRELTPTLMALAGLNKGRCIELPKDAAYCELGCGHGFSANLLAAANPQFQFHSNDFNPSHVAGARRLAREAGLSNAHFYEESFADFANVTGLPAQFDVIALHGVYSWVSPENREHLIIFISQRLKPGGLVFISYNTLPGWASMMPLRRVVVDHAARSGGPLPSRIKDALAFAEDLVGIDAAYFRQNSSAGAQLAQMKTMSQNYLAHEYFNRDWTHFYFEDVAADLSRAKLSFVGSANLLDHLDALKLTDQQRDFLSKESDPLRREGLRDILLNERFRCDLFTKGAGANTFRSGVAAWLATRFTLTSKRKDIPATIKGARKHADSPPAIAPLLDALANGPRTTRELLGDAVVAAMNWDQITQALAVLVGSGHVQPCLPEDGESVRHQSCRAFNLAVCTRSEETQDYQFLASPITGGGVAVDRIEQLFLIAIREGHGDPASWARFAWQVLAPQGNKLVQHGAILETPEENVAFLDERAASFAANRLPLLEGLKVGL